MGLLAKAEQVLKNISKIGKKPVEDQGKEFMRTGIDGFDITRWIRDRSDAPIIMLTARRGEVDRIAGLEMGADDYVVKPFSPQELVSRVRAVLRRTQKATQETVERPLVFDDLQIDPQTRLVTVRGAEISLTAKEFDMLWLLACHPRQVFSRQQLLERVWGWSDYIDPTTVTVNVRRLRVKVEHDSSNPLHIITDLGAIIQGGLGIAAGGNINPEGVSMFEPMGGSAPKYTGKNIINPMAAISAAQMMLEELGQERAAGLIEKGVMRVLKHDIKSLSAGEMGHTTSEVGDLVVTYIHEAAREAFA